MNTPTYSIPKIVVTESRVKDSNMPDLKFAQLSKNVFAMSKIDEEGNQEYNGLFPCQG